MVPVADTAKGAAPQYAPYVHTQRADQRVTEDPSVSYIEELRDTGDHDSLIKCFDCRASVSTVLYATDDSKCTKPKVSS